MLSTGFMSQSEWAEELGITKQAVNLWFKGYKEPLSEADTPPTIPKAKHLRKIYVLFLRLPAKDPHYEDERTAFEQFNIMAKRPIQEVSLDPKKFKLRDSYANPTVLDYIFEERLKEFDANVISYSHKLREGDNQDCPQAMCAEFCF